MENIDELLRDADLPECKMCGHYPEIEKKEVWCRNLNGKYSPMFRFIVSCPSCNYTLKINDWRSLNEE